MAMRCSIIDGAPARLARNGIAPERFRTLEAGANWSIPALSE
jgi:hypothetical protein